MTYAISKGSHLNLQLLNWTISSLTGQQHEIFTIQLCCLIRLVFNISTNFWEKIWKSIKNRKKSQIQLLRARRSQEVSSYCIFIHVSNYLGKRAPARKLQVMETSWLHRKSHPTASLFTFKATWESALLPGSCRWWKPADCTFPENWRQILLLIGSTFFYPFLLKRLEQILPRIRFCGNGKTYRHKISKRKNGK